MSKKISTAKDKPRLFRSKKDFGQMLLTLIELKFDCEWWPSSLRQQSSIDAVMAQSAMAL